MALNSDSNSPARHESPPTFPRVDPQTTPLEKKAKGDSYLKTFNRSFSLSSLQKKPKVPNVDDPTVMTIEFLWTRLQTERAECQAQKEKVQRLARKVIELEDILQNEFQLSKEFEPYMKLEGFASMQQRQAWIFNGLDEEDHEHSSSYSSYIEDALDQKRNWRPSIPFECIPTQESLEISSNGAMYKGNKIERLCEHKLRLDQSDDAFYKLQYLLPHKDYLRINQEFKIKSGHEVDCDKRPHIGKEIKLKEHDINEASRNTIQNLVHLSCAQENLHMDGQIEIVEVNNETNLNDYLKNQDEDKRKVDELLPTIMGKEFQQATLMEKISRLFYKYSSRNEHESRRSGSN